MTTLADHIATARGVADDLRKGARTGRHSGASMAMGAFAREVERGRADFLNRRAAAIEALIEKVESGNG